MNNDGRVVEMVRIVVDFHYNEYVCIASDQYGQKFLEMNQTFTSITEARAAARAMVLENFRRGYWNGNTYAALHNF